jgi:hypothetical protein
MSDGGKEAGVFYTVRHGLAAEQTTVRTGS